MGAAKGYYSVIQYCPDTSRSESANVGVALLCPDRRSLSVMVSEGLSRVRRFFKPSEIRLRRIENAASAVATFLSKRAQDYLDPDKFAQYTQSMGNEVRMTVPRVVRIEDATADLARLYAELVEDEQQVASARPATILPTRLNEVFTELVKTKKVFKPKSITVPILNRQLKIPYAFRNEVLNLLKPLALSDDVGSENKVTKLAVEGDLLQEKNQEKCKLIIISGAGNSEESEERFGPLLERYHVRLIRQSQAEQFGREVLEHAK